MRIPVSKPSDTKLINFNVILPTQMIVGRMASELMHWRQKGEELFIALDQYKLQCTSIAIILEMARNSRDGVNYGWRLSCMKRV